MEQPPGLSCGWELQRQHGLSALVLKKDPTFGDVWMWLELAGGWGVQPPKAVQQTLEGHWLGMLQRDSGFLHRIKGSAPGDEAYKPINFCMPGQGSPFNQFNQNPSGVLETVQLALESQLTQGLPPSLNPAIPPSSQRSESFSFPESSQASAGL